MKKISVEYHHTFPYFNAVIFHIWASSVDISCYDEMWDEWVKGSVSLLIDPDSAVEYGIDAINREAL